MLDWMTNYSLQISDNHHYVFLIATPDKENSFIEAISFSRKRNGIFNSK